MDKNIVALPGYQVCEYLLVIEPHQDLYDRIKALKEEFAKSYDAPLAHSTKPYITLVNFLAYEMTEDKLRTAIETSVSVIKPFKVELSNFGTFPSHTVYINVTTKVPIQQVVQQLKGLQKLMAFDREHKPHFIQESHVTVCRKLKPWQFEKSSLEYAHRQFSGRFIAQNVTMLKRPVTETKYTVASSFQFRNAGGVSKQGDLF